MTDDPTESTAVGADARELNEQPLLTRAKITAAHGRRLGGGIGLFVIVFYILITLVVPPYLPPGEETVSILPVVVVTAFVFETLDSAAGMGIWSDRWRGPLSAGLPTRGGRASVAPVRGGHWACRWAVS
ncbi:MAG: hypothetical protein J07HX5_00312 [halophilic archaeon J07HX5]|nr:MAG: hypothetical protein J07HX5_00312 [halophilic archaeon J07HX5]